MASMPDGSGTHRSPPGKEASDPQPHRLGIVLQRGEIEHTWPRAAYLTRPLWIVASLSTTSSADLVQENGAGRFSAFLLMFRPARHSLVAQARRHRAYPCYSTNRLSSLPPGLTSHPLSWSDVANSLLPCPSGPAAAWKETVTTASKPLLRIRTTTVALGLSYSPGLRCNYEKPFVTSRFTLSIVSTQRGVGLRAAVSFAQRYPNPASMASLSTGP
ncbi:hypothetical protein VTK73DRAFT_7371 [Phialemonium thermophilum]|uniref:Uncharacterized protein n=1 Tax=Phialemonium thermophilum TaxID=223376 RepID=A0ABR3WF61_9PEZI